jgi:hypothetical protein
LNTRLLAVILPVALALASGAVAQPAPSPTQEVEEVTITAQRAARALRLQLEQAEKSAYDLFNRYNDDKRFRISCSKDASTGSNFRRQVCQPEFERQAMSAHGKDYLHSLQALLGGGDDGTFMASTPVDAAIAAQLPALQRKMKQLAEQHPDFLEAVIAYGKLRQASAVKQPEAR